MATLTREPATPGQTKQLTRVVQDAAEQGVLAADLEKGRAQKAHANGDELAAKVKEAVRLALLELSATDEYKDEEVPSQYGYLSGYDGNPNLEKNLADLEAELGILRQAFSELATADLDREYLAKIQSGKIVLPKGCERWAIIPRWQKIASTYSGATAKIIAAVKAARGSLYNYREGEIDESHLRQTTRSVLAWEKIGAAQQGDFLIVPIQAGIAHRGRSVRRAREVFEGDEFGLGAFAVGIIVLTHPERLSNVDDLWMDCAGDEWSPEADGDFSRCPYWYFRDSKVKFDTDGVVDAHGYFGSVSGRVPQ